MRTVLRAVGSGLVRALAGLFANTFGTYIYKAADRAGEVSKIIELMARSETRGTYMGSTKT